MRRHPGIPFRAGAGVALSTALLWSAGEARAADGPPQPAGVRYEMTPAAGPARAERLEALEREISAAPGGEALLGRVRLDLGRPLEAEDALRRALKQTGRGVFEDDAAFALIEAIEANGRTDEAEKQWKQWEKRWGNGPLAAEAMLRRAWNDLRRDDLAAANGRIARIVKQWPWFAADARFALTRAFAEALSGDPRAAIATIGPEPAGPAAGFLSAICMRRTGDRLRAAAAFQQVADRHPDSPLRDPALLAKADVFLEAGDHRSAAAAFDRVAARVRAPRIRAEAELRAAGARFLAGDTDSALVRLRALIVREDGGDIAARGQFLIGEVLVANGRTAEAIVEYNRVLTRYFQHKVAASAQYRVARCLDALGRHADATGSYQAVVRGYPLEPEAPAAAYLAGVGLLQQNRAAAATPYFQLVLDRYAARLDATGAVVFAKPEHGELVDAALCLLQYAWHQTGNLGQMSGASHALLQKLPPSRSLWRAHALLFDADALASQGRMNDARAVTEALVRDYPDHAVGARASRLLAWIHSREGNDSLAIAIEERMLARAGRDGDTETVRAALLDIAHERFNQKRYKEAAAAYEEFLKRHPGDPGRFAARYQAGLCYLRLDLAGDALDRWEALIADSAGVPIAERAWARIGDLYFQAERYDDARRAYRGLLDYFAATPAAALAGLRLAQCDYNGGHDAEALEAFSALVAAHGDAPIGREAARGVERTLYRLSQRDDGDAVLAKLVERYPGSPFAADAQFQIARRHYDAKRWSDAADAFRRVVSQFPGYSGADQAQYLMADAYAQNGLEAEARRGWEQFIAYFPGSELGPMVQFRLGLARFQAREFLEASVAFEGVAADSLPEDVRSAALYNLALCRRELGDVPAARTALARHETQFPAGSRGAQVAYQIGDLDEAAGRTAAAAAAYQRALDAKPDASLKIELAFRLGRCREALGETDLALAAYARAVAAGDREHPYRLSALARSAALYEGRREFSRALEAYRDIVRHARDRELVAAATDRVSQLESASRGKARR
jgi:TolA-binding protein